MRRFVLATLLVLFAALPWTARGVSFDLNYSDPASDVVQLWGTNLTPVTDTAGNLVMNPFPDAVNIRWLRSAEDGANVTLTLETKGAIEDAANTSYEIRLYPRSDNATQFAVTYTNGTMSLDSNETAFVAVNLTGNSTITSTGPNPTLPNTLRLTIAKSLLGNITAWNIDATATKLGAPYAYRDFGWEVPGNPGSSPTQLTGVVTDRDTGVPLAGVNVSTELGGFWILTNATGEYALLVTPGNYTVTFSRDGYASSSATVTVLLGQAKALDMRLQAVPPPGFTASPALLLLLLLLAVVAVIVVAAVLRRRR